MSTSPYFTILVVDPATTLEKPYSHLQTLYGSRCIVTHVQTIQEAEEKIATENFQLVMISTQYMPMSTVELLEKIKNRATDALTSVIFVIDWNYRLHRVLGTHWGEQIGVLHSLSSAEEVDATMKRLQLV